MFTMVYKHSTCTARDLLKNIFPADRIGQTPDYNSAFAMKFLFRERYNLYVTEDFIISVWTELNGGNEHV